MAKNSPQMIATLFLLLLISTESSSSLSSTVNEKLEGLLQQVSCRQNSTDCIQICGNYCQSLCGHSCPLMRCDNGTCFCSCN
ncbi:hypothetical protein KFK09_012893 [Dendrobium nobile]|uniref:Uncharacterized protein n=1 Tax=Dendrobium nobile TaxID=94219 RepID=A0A8T3BKN6_DENNO|nr:hypothetical protein KFK09_012893 [Dendrobium nobile]